MITALRAGMMVLVLLVAALARADAQDATPPLNKFVLTSTSATACTQLGISAPGTLVALINTGPATTVFPQFFDDTKCTVQANVVFGDYATIALASGETALGIPLSTGLSYRLSGALGATQNIIVTYYGLRSVLP